VLEEVSDYRLDVAAAQRAFDRASSSFDAAAVLQAEVRGELLTRLDLTALNPAVVLDAGAGTGRASALLKRRYPRAHVIAVDASLAMLRVARTRSSWMRPFDRIAADAERLPLADASVDLIFSNLLLPWCDPERLLGEFRRVLAPHGLLSLSAFGPDTLREFRLAWAEVDAAVHVHRFIDMHDLGDALVRAGFAAPVLDVERYTLTYTDLRAVAADLRAVGGSNASRDRPHGLTGRGKFSRLAGAYEAFRADGRLPASYEIVFAQAWAPAATGPARRRDATVSLAEVERQLSERRRRS
jgi:malonyl-CoA O-methyltransferase